MYPQKMRRHSALLRCTPQNKRAGLSSPLESDRENLGAVSDDSQNSVIPYLLGSLQGHPTYDTHPPLQWGQQAQVKQAVPENAQELTSAFCPDQGSLHHARCSQSVLPSLYLHRDFPGGPVLENPPANAGAMGLIPCPGRPHMPRSN